MKYILLSITLFLYSFCLFGQKPNVILIYADDLGYGDPGCYGGNKIPTPNIDFLAKEGVKFSNAYVTAPVCGPSRYGLLTGAYQQRFGVYTNDDTWSKIPGIEHIIPTYHNTIDQTLKLGGYVTGMVGKWNLENTPKTTFDESMSVMHFVGEYWPDKNGNYNGVNSGRANVRDSTLSWGPEREGDEYLTDRLGRQSVEFIEKHKEEPFFLYLAFNAPHSPLQAKKEHLKDVAHIPTEPYKLYAAMTLSMDENIGKIIQKLDELGLRENTIIAFASDNGPTRGFDKGWPEGWKKELLGSTAGLRGFKNLMYEGGIRVPYIISWPNKIKKGITYDAPVSTMDIYPTFCAAAKQPIPTETKLDGVNLLPYINGEIKEIPHQKLFWFRENFGAMRDGDWKLLVKEDNVSLYNLKKDEKESINLASEKIEIKNRMLDEFQTFKSKMPKGINQIIRKKRLEIAQKEEENGKINEN